jgi:hypothetical protein
MICHCRDKLIYPVVVPIAIRQFGCHIVESKAELISILAMVSESRLIPSIMTCSMALAIADDLAMSFAAFKHGDANSSRKQFLPLYSLSTGQVWAELLSLACSCRFLPSFNGKDA